MNKPIITLVVLFVTASLAAAADVLAAIGAATIFAQSALAQTTTTTTSTTQENNTTSLAIHIQITKDATSSYAISEGSAQIGSFDTVYVITGLIDDISGNNNLITSTIQDDFNASSTAGYVMAQETTASSNNSTQTTTTTTLPNQFASSEEIRQRIADEIQKGIEAAERSEERYAEIRCNFGMDLPRFECMSIPLLGQVQ
ncbi:MAG: hypothetical protein QXX64_02465 [Nitrososphaera sp.]|uniref:Uncharacterized protein n=1 Tax=Nitrososphaera gargensis (strain Ga9.2) TaxID=1237085 RepID=K0IL38_NITGG|nr:hypothetical protein [Candidatus Nitrososphaera gargensis]AFU59307.1 hypothetical protein Ngar_c23820 [Candidatus Nitrososphaera gargensis Ga9.2]